MMINGQWAKDFDPVQATDDEGGFVRQASQFRHWITPDGAAGPSGSGGFAATSGRYHLYAGLICPWASRALMVRQLKGLAEHISVTLVDPRPMAKVWRFGHFPGSEPEPLYGAEYLYELYLRADAHYSGQITIPVLWDRERETIVNNESSEIIRMFNSGFGELADDRYDLYPAALRDEIDAVNARLYEPFNNGVYRAGFATTQIAYEHAVAEVFDSLDWMAERLQGQAYLVGDRLSEADVRAFVTLVRFDAAYHGLFKCNRRRVADYPVLHDYIERLYALPGVAETVNLAHIKQGYYHILALNPQGIVPVGPEQPW